MVIGRTLEKPFRMPESYLERLEGVVTARVEAPQKRSFRTVVRPALGLACAFALVFGMGYGVLALTGTLDRKGSGPMHESYSLFDEGIVSSSFLDFYDDFQEEYGTEAEAEDIQAEEDLMEYLESEISYSELSEIYAQLQ